MTRIRRLISSITGRFLPGTADDYKPGDVIVSTHRRGSRLTAGDRQKLTSALGLAARTRHNLDPGSNPSPLERAVLDLLDKAG